MFSSKSAVVLIMSQHPTVINFYLIILTGKRIHSPKSVKSRLHNELLCYVLCMGKKWARWWQYVLVNVDKEGFRKIETKKSKQHKLPSILDTCFYIWNMIENNTTICKIFPTPTKKQKGGLRQDFLVNFSLFHAALLGCNYYLHFKM